MHILITADTVGGVWNYTRELVTGLARRGVRVTLVSFGGVPTAEQRAWLEGVDGVRYLPTAYRLEWMQDAERDLRESARYLREVIRDARPDLLHLSQFCYGEMDVNQDVTQPKIVVAHSDVLSWRQAVHGELPSGPWAKWYRGVVRKGLAGASLVVAPSQWMLRSVEDCYGRQPQSRVIYNGRTPAWFDPMARKENYAASAGRLWDEGKQLRLLMEMERPPLPIRVAGATALVGERARGNPKGAPGVQFVGELSEDAMRELLSRAAIYIATSKYEPFGLAPLEAALSRCAIVANDIPSLREVWEDTVLYFRKDDARSLCEALVRLHGDRELRMEYANRAYERAVRHYMAGRMVDEYMETYASLLGSRARAA
ncbi:MAG: glycosyltransferase family 4 protein [Candidatus Korobacteraceae bacterium]